MIDQRDFVLSPDSAHSPDKLASFLAAEMGEAYLAACTYRIEKRSIDARSRQIKVNLRIGFYEEGHDFSLSSQLPSLTKDAKKVIIIGSGPAGLFAAIDFVKKGIKPIVLERGKDVRDRRRDLAAINRFNIVDPDSNYCFGEGGAGTYSDGKLYTRSTKRGDIKSVLETFVAHGAHSDILFEAHPHIGTNKLPGIIASMRDAVIAAGGEVHFHHRVIDFLIVNNSIRGAVCSNGAEFQADRLLLATGHSARDIFQLLQTKGVAIEAKPFAIGVRI